jgi:BASS family bile acid:Na+ symporter
MAIPAAIYGILAFFTAAAFGWMINRLHGQELSVKE